MLSIRPKANQARSDLILFFLVILEFYYLSIDSLFKMCCQIILCELYYVLSCYSILHRIFFLSCYGLLQDNEYTSLAIQSDLVVYPSIYNLKLPIHSFPCPPSPLSTTSLFSMSVSLFLFCK